MSVIIVTRGLPASGKSTWAKEWVAERDGRARVNRDDIRMALFGKCVGLSFQQEEAVTSVETSCAVESLNKGWDVVVDACHLRNKYITRWWALAKKHGAEMKIVEFSCDVDTAIARDAERERTVGAENIRKLLRFMPKGRFAQWSPPVSDAPSLEKHSEVPGRSTAMIVDLDGTMALMGDRDPYSVDVADDAPNVPVVDAVEHMSGKVDMVVFMSGRKSAARRATVAWLNEHFSASVPWVLHMRADDDNRRDDVVKYDLFNAHVRDNFNVRWVFDDRNQVVKMWRELGLPVFQVADGDF